MAFQKNSLRSLKQLWQEKRTWKNHGFQWSQSIKVIKKNEYRQNKLFTIYIDANDSIHKNSKFQNGEIFLVIYITLCKHSSWRSDKGQFRKWKCISIDGENQFLVKGYWIQQNKIAWIWTETYRRYEIVTL